MELSFNWLSQYVNHGASVAEVAERHIDDRVGPVDPQSKRC